MHTPKAMPALYHRTLARLADRLGLPWLVHRLYRFIVFDRSNGLANPILLIIPQASNRWRRNRAKPYSMNEKVIVLHQYGAPSHYRALEYHVKSNGGRIVYREFTIWKPLRKSLRTLSIRSFIKCILNITNLVHLFFTKNKTVVLGMAPKDERIFFLRHILKRHRIHYHTSWPYWDKGFFPFDNPGKITERQWKLFLERDIASIVCATHECKRTLQLTYHIKAPIYVVGHSINPDYFYPAETISDRKHVKYLYVGCFTENKGIHEIFKIIDNLPKETSEFTFVGKGDLESEIVSFCTTRPNCRHIRFVDSEKALGDIYRDHDILLLPTQQIEGFGMVIIEAMGCGVIPVTTDQVGPCEIITNNVNGYIYPKTSFPQNVCCLHDKIMNRKVDIHQTRLHCIRRSKDYHLDQVAKIWMQALSGSSN
jgi:glycosyltransferase involved in cell wall biosynthesis